MTIKAICFDWGGTLMSEDGPEDIPMGLWPHVQRLDGALETVQLLSASYPLHIATNATVSRRPMIAQALARVDLLRYFDQIFCYTELGVRKDNPEFWRFVCQTLKVEPQELAMVGDSYQQDAAAPRRFGVQAVWLSPMPSDGSDASVPRVADLRAFANWIWGMP